MTSSHPLDQFEAIWSGGGVPDLRQFVTRLLQAGEDSLLSELCQIDLERRWRFTKASIEKRFAHDYLCLSEVSLNRADAIALICWEYHVRNRWGDYPGTKSILAQWPQYLPDLDPALCAVLAETPRPVVSLSGDHELLRPFPLDGKLNVGRQRPGDPPPYGLVSTPDGIRLIIAAATDSSISRQQLMIQQISSTALTVANTSRNRAIAVARLGAIDAGCSATCPFPARIHLARATFLCIDRSE